jgi:hypothetical protein
MTLGQGNHPFTPKTTYYKNLNGMIGKILHTCLLPTYYGKLLYVRDGKCYFEVVANPKVPKFDVCVGKIEYIPEYLVVTMKFED